MKDFRTLTVWQKAHELTLLVYRAMQAFPREELYGLTSQLRRGCASIGSNIAEGCGRGSDADFARCLQIGLGSASEVEYQLLLAHDLSLLDVSRTIGWPSVVQRSSACSRPSSENSRRIADR